MLSQFKKHGISLEEVKRILRNDEGVNRKEFEDPEPSPTGNDRTLLMGFSKPNRLIEVKLEWEGTGHGTITGVTVFHAMEATDEHEADYFEDV